jgi:hypothetical protein
MRVQEMKKMLCPKVVPWWSTGADVILKVPAIEAQKFVRLFCFVFFFGGLRGNSLPY